MRAIVTGGAGFIGSYLCEELVKRNISISVWDNLFRGNMDNIRHLLNDTNRFFNIDLSDSKNIEQMVALLLEEKPRYIFHYAAINGTQYFYDIPAKVLEVNVAITYNLMLALREVKKIDPSFYTKMIYASSSEVYGEPFNVPSKEFDITYVNTEHVRDSYAISKLIGEFYVKLIGQEIGIEWIVMRLFNVYGNRMVGTKYGQVIPEFINRLKNGEYPLKIYGNGEHKKSFCYVSDNVEFTIDLALSKVINDTFNIGNSTEISIKELGSFIMEKMGMKPLFEYLPERIGDHKRRCPDTSKLHSVIGKKEYLTLDLGINLMLDK